TAQDLAANAPDNLASLRGFFARQPQAVTSALLTRISADGPGVTPAEIAGLDLPTLIIGTQLDAVHPLGHAEALAALIPAPPPAPLSPRSPPRPRTKPPYTQDSAPALPHSLPETPT